MKKSGLLICGFLLASPIIVDWIVSKTSCTIHYDGWLGYYGTLVGTLVTLFILYKTRSWNKDDNDDTRQQQVKMSEYQAKTLWFENFRKQLDENYRILNFQDTITAVNEISMGNCQKALSSLLELNKNIEMQGYTFDLYLPTMKLGQEEKDYVDCYNKVLRMYGTYVNDLIIICGLRQRLGYGLPIDKYINDTVARLNALNDVNKDVEPSQFLLSLAERVNANCTYAEVESMLFHRVDDTSLIHCAKTDLAKVTRTLLKFEEQKIQEILM